MKYPNLIGKRFNRLTVVSQGPTKNEKRTWNCTCDCGGIVVIPSGALKSGNSKSCGCLRIEKCSVRSMSLLEKVHRDQVTHGGTGTRLFRIWKGMRTRCYQKSNPSFVYYGQRGIKICDDWKNDFGTFRIWAHSNGYLPHLSIERLDVDGDYDPKNCAWIPKNEQPKNTRRSLKNRWKLEA